MGLIAGAAEGTADDSALTVSTNTIVLAEKADFTVTAVAPADEFPNTPWVALYPISRLDEILNPNNPGGSIWWYAVNGVSGGSNEHTSGEAVKPYTDGGAWHNLSAGYSSTSEFELSAGEYVLALFADDPAYTLIDYELITVVEEATTDTPDTSDTPDAPQTGDATVAIVIAAAAALGGALVIGKKRA